MADTKKINDTKIKACIRDIIAENDNDLEYGLYIPYTDFDSKITTGLVRKELEKKLKVESGAFSSEKERISTLLQEVLDQLSAKEEEEPFELIKHKIANELKEIRQVWKKYLIIFNLNVRN